MGRVRSAYEVPVTGPTGHKRGTMKEEILGVLESRGALLLKDIYPLHPGHSKPSIRGTVYKMVTAGVLEKTPEGKYRLKKSGVPAPAFMVATRFIMLRKQGDSNESKGFGSGYSQKDNREDETG